MGAVDYDPFSPETMADPYPDLLALLDRCPVHHDAGSGLFTMTPWDDVTSALMNPAVYSSAQGPGPTPPPREGLNVLVGADDPAHAAQRRVVARYYTPRRVEAFEPRVREICDGLIAGFVDAGACDLVHDFAYPLAIRVVAEFLGFDLDDEQTVKIKDLQIAGLRALSGDPEHLEAGIAAFTESAEYMLAHIADRRARIERGEEVPDDPITALLTPGDDGDAPTFSDDELLGITQQLLNHETTAAMFLHGMHLLLTHPGEMDKLRMRPELVENAVEEILRFRAPVPGLCRALTRDETLEGVEMPEGSRVRLMYAAANHDGAHWDEPEVFRVDRDLGDVRRHLSFGLGIHLCLGAPLARLEGRLAFGGLLERLPGLRLDPEHPPELDPTIWIVNTYRTFPLRWDA